MTSAYFKSACTSINWRAAGCRLESASREKADLIAWFERFESQTLRVIHNMTLHFTTLLTYSAGTGCFFGTFFTDGIVAIGNGIRSYTREANRWTSSTNCAAGLWSSDAVLVSGARLVA